MAAPASGSRRQSQAVAKKQASFCWPCFPYYLSLLAFLFPNKQPKLPSPTFLVLLPFPAFLVLLALSSHSSQTDNQTNNQRNKQTHKQETNKHTNKCSKMFPETHRCSQKSQILLDAPRCCQRLPETNEQTQTKQKSNKQPETNEQTKQTTRNKQTTRTVPKSCAREWPEHKKGRNRARIGRKR